MLLYEFDKLVFKWNEMEGLISKNEKFDSNEDKTKHSLL